MSRVTSQMIRHAHIVDAGAAGLMSWANAAVARQEDNFRARPTFPPLRTRNNSLPIIIINDAAVPLPVA